jgi:hypothetical protein
MGRAFSETEKRLAQYGKRLLEATALRSVHGDTEARRHDGRSIVTGLHLQGTGARRRTGHRAQVAGRTERPTAAQGASRPVRLSPHSVSYWHVLTSAMKRMSYFLNRRSKTADKNVKSVAEGKKC